MRAPIIVGVGGAFSGVGKTTTACSVLRLFENWGAVKYSKTLLSSLLIDDLAMLSQRGKDTALMLGSGAQRVIWLRSSRFRLKSILQDAVCKLSDLDGIVVEGNSAVALTNPDVVIFVADGENVKTGAEKVLTMADIILYNVRPPHGGKRNVQLFRKDDPEFQRHLLALIDNIKVKRYQRPIIGPLS